jgi:putative endonuclease
MERTYFVYILSSRSRNLYVGISSDLLRRMWEHRTHAVPGHTARYRIDRLVYFEPFADPASAIAREKWIKGWLRSRKIALIEQSNPTWEDFAKDWFDNLTSGKAGPSLRSG